MRPSETLTSLHDTIVYGLILFGGFGLIALFLWFAQRRWPDRFDKS